jgi:hypothetical protein
MAEKILFLEIKFLFFADESTKWIDYLLKRME